MKNSINEALIDCREVVFENAPVGTRFAFGLADDTDAGDTAAGPLFKQDGDFYLFEFDVDTTRRAGPGVNSPTRCWGTLAISLQTKDQGREIRFMRQLEQVASWFAEKTVRDIRFRTFTPLPRSRLIGFTSYQGVINFDFEVTK